MTLALGAALAALVALAAVGAGPAEAQKKGNDRGKIVFASDRTTGKGVDNPEGDFEIFVMDPNGKNPKQLTRNSARDYNPILSPDGQKIAYHGSGNQSSNQEGDPEVYVVNVLDGSKPKNLTNNTASDYDD